MDDERFDDEVRQRTQEPQIVLKDGRTFKYNYILRELIGSGIEESLLKEVLYKKLFNNPMIKEVSPEIEKAFARKSLKRENYQEVKVTVCGIPSTDPRFHSVLLQQGTQYII